MTKTLLIAASVCIAGAAFAQTKPTQTPKKIACPVMPDHKVDGASATKKKMYVDHKGRRYFMCCAGCGPAFKANPAKYAKMPSIPTPKPAKS